MLENVISDLIASNKCFSAFYYFTLIFKLLLIKEFYIAFLNSEVEERNVWKKYHRVLTFVHFYVLVQLKLLKMRDSLPKQNRLYRLDAFPTLSLFRFFIREVDILIPFNFDIITLFARLLVTLWRRRRIGSAFKIEEFCFTDCCFKSFPNEECLNALNSFLEMNSLLREVDFNERNVSVNTTEYFLNKRWQF